MSGNAVAFGLGGVHLVATNTYRSDPILATTLIALLMPPHIKAALIWSLYHTHHYSVDVSLWSRVLSYHDQGHRQSLTLWITTIFDCSCPPANNTCLQRTTPVNWQPFNQLIENQTNHYFIHLLNQQQIAWLPTLYTKATFKICAGHASPMPLQV